MLEIIKPNSDLLKKKLGSSHERFAQLVSDAEKKARPFYRKLFNEDLGIEDVIKKIFSAIEKDGDLSVAYYSELFDKSSVDSGNLLVTADEIKKAYDFCDKDLKKAIVLAVDRVKDYQKKLLPKGFGEDLSSSLGVKYVSLERVGSYVPGGMGGSLPLCSTVIMNLVPALVAGVKELVLATPPRPDGTIAPEILAACYAAGVKTVYKAGGIPAIAAMSIGTDSLPAVDKIVGPGNIFVTLSKKYAYGRVDLDMLAGPSEVLVIADDSANPSWMAADLLSQAEHDALAAFVFCGVGEKLCLEVVSEIEKQLEALPEDRKIVAKASVLNNACIINCDNLTEAISISNFYAPEHLEIVTEDNQSVFDEIKNAGAVFVGQYSPEPIGDYIAGPSHTLPTGGTAKVWSGIGADTFIKRMSIINFDKEEFESVAEPAMLLARAEGLEAHARSIGIRLK